MPDAPFLQYALKAVVAFVAPYLVIAVAWATAHGFDVSWLTEEWLLATLTAVVTAVGVYRARNAPKA